MQSTWLTEYGNSIEFTIDPATPLLRAIDEQPGLTGTNFGCGMAPCGACTHGENDYPMLVDAQLLSGKRQARIIHLPRTESAHAPMADEHLQMPDAFVTIHGLQQIIFCDFECMASRERPSKKSDSQFGLIEERQETIFGRGAKWLY